MVPVPNVVRFVVLHHTFERPGPDDNHFDLMIEDPDATAPRSLATWRLPHWPIKTSGEATRLDYHDLSWLDRQGPVSSGRGTAVRVARGQCRVVIADDLAWHVTFPANEEASLISRQVNEPDQQKTAGTETWPSLLPHLKGPSIVLQPGRDTSVWLLQIVETAC